MEKRFGVIILAAGNSVRMGRPKQSLLLQDQTLLERIVNTAASLSCGPVIIVLNETTPALKHNHDNIITVINARSKEGIASSIVCGIDTLQKRFEDVRGAIISVCDQPYVTTELLQEMINKHLATALPVIACSYGNTVGTPVLFHHTVFFELMQLKGDKGAKAIIQNNKDRVGLVNFPLGNIDIDTKEDYDQLLQNEVK